MDYKVTLFTETNGQHLELVKDVTDFTVQDGNLVLYRGAEQGNGVRQKTCGYTRRQCMWRRRSPQ